MIPNTLYVSSVYGLDNKGFTVYHSGLICLVLYCIAGVLMLMDIFHERGFPMAVYIYGDPDECRFPLFDFLSPLPLQWMYVVYLALILGMFVCLFVAFLGLSLLPSQKMFVLYLTFILSMLWQPIRLSFLYFFYLLFIFLEQVIGTQKTNMQYFLYTLLCNLKFQPQVTS